VANVHGSLTGGLIPLSLNQGPIDFNAIVTQTIQLSGLDLPGSHKTTTDLQMAYKNANSGTEDMKTGACFYTPASAQSSLAIGHAADYRTFADHCNPQPPPPECPIDVVLNDNPTIPDTSCKLTNASAYPKDSNLLSPVEQTAFPNGMPANLVKVLDYVGGLYSVPPSVVLANMLQEGAFKHYPTWQWTDATVKTYSNCTITEPMPSCNDSDFQSSTGAKGPLGIFQAQTDKVDLTSTDEYTNPYWKILNDPKFKDVLKNRPKGTFGACNFFDAALFAAWDIYENQEHIYGIAVPPACTINGVDYPLSQDTNRAASCSDWKPDRAGLARWQYDDRQCDVGIPNTEKTFSGY
jgi:hypothetical protein